MPCKFTRCTLVSESVILIVRIRDLLDSTEYVSTPPIATNHQTTRQDSCSIGHFVGLEGNLGGAQHG